jgi:hypothetical protein
LNWFSRKRAKESDYRKDEHSVISKEQKKILKNYFMRVSEKPDHNNLKELSYQLNCPFEKVVRFFVNQRYLKKQICIHQNKTKTNTVNY